MSKKTEAKATNFYKKVIQLLQKNDLPFMIGGTFAFSWYTGIARPTKDMDLFSTPEVYPSILQVAHKAGYTTELLDEHWIAKIHKNTSTTDIIFAEKNGLNKVTNSWFVRAPHAEVMGFSVRLMPLEEMIKSKAFIQNKNRFDGPDVTHLLLRQGDKIDWKLLLALIEPHWEVIFAHIINFIFVYPSNRDIIPYWVMEKLIKRLQTLLVLPPNHTRVTRGLLFSMGYKVSIEKWGYKDISRIEKGITK